MIDVVKQKNPTVEKNLTQAVDDYIQSHPSSSGINQNQQLVFLTSAFYSALKITSGKDAMQVRFSLI